MNKIFKKVIEQKKMLKNIKKTFDETFNRKNGILLISGGGGV